VVQFHSTPRSPPPTHYKLCPSYPQIASPWGATSCPFTSSTAASLPTAKTSPRKTAIPQINIRVLLTGTAFLPDIALDQ